MNKKLAYCLGLRNINGSIYFDKLYKSILGLLVKLYMIYKVNFGLGKTA
ncbi:conserved hypothetical protein [Xenorhabdus bovienii str. kraussei Quebec]|uniref:Uncharacterized protein n=2 Tax=Xenorhabdus bovienii TaxID=40576 RepID=A0A077P302_XENBV|nr:conserved hypothetical protein [Xenorhabdus bovienii str. oregonense]CDH18825.1 conserved hypothetical protein [Xenorhabdus bovienii str. kraussei Quebec]